MIFQFLQNSHHSYQKTTRTPNNQFFPTVPHTCFSTKFRTTFNFIETFTNDKPCTGATIIQNSTNHVSTLPSGNIGYIEVPITNERPEYYQVHDINSLVHNVAHIYHPEITEAIVPTNYAPLYNEDTLYYPQISLNRLYMTDSSKTPNRPKSHYNVQPSSHTRKPCIFTSFPYTEENLNFIKKNQRPIF